MKFDCKFKGLDHSPSMAEYAQDKFKKLEKFELKPTAVHITFSAVRHNKNVDVYFNGLDGIFRAKASSPDFKESLDKVIDKLMKQMDREKRIKQKHKSYEKSHLAKIDREIELLKAS